MIANVISSSDLCNCHTAGNEYKSGLHIYYFQSLTSHCPGEFMMLRKSKKAHTHMDRYTTHMM